MKLYIPIEVEENVTTKEDVIDQFCSFLKDDDYLDVTICGDLSLVISLHGYTNEEYGIFVNQYSNLSIKGKDFNLYATITTIAIVMEAFYNFPPKNSETECHVVRVGRMNDFKDYLTLLAI